MREDYICDTIDVLPMYAVSPRNDGYFPSVSPISSPNAMNTPDSPVTPATGSVTLLSELLIPLPEVMLLKPALALHRYTHTFTTIT